MSAAKALGPLARLVRWVSRTPKGVAEVGKAGGKAAKGTSNALKLGALGGLTSFFGFEWLINGGLVRGVAGTLGIQEWAASILIVAVVLIILGVLIYVVYQKLSGPKRTSSSSRSSGSRSSSRSSSSKAKGRK